MVSDFQTLDPLTKYIRYSYNNMNLVFTILFSALLSVSFYLVNWFSTMQSKYSVLQTRNVCH